MKAVIVGLGGVGSRLVDPLCQYLRAKKEEATIVLVDGDSFEPKNQERQVFSTFGPKASVIGDRLSSEYPEFQVEAYDAYLTSVNASMLIDDDVTHVFCCVDNHASRKTVCERVAELRDCTLFSGGNEYSDGNVQIYARRGGQDETPPITRDHPEIASPSDKNPADLSCEELTQTSSPQLLFANMKVATEMLGAMWAQESGDISYSEVYFDLKSGRQRPVKREVMR